MNTLKYFYGSFFITIVGFVIGIYLYPSNTWSVLYSLAILALLEISLSFDNAIINAKTLTGMSELWQKLFILVGFPIAVFGMRLVFPILLVSISSHIGFIDVINLAINYPAQYQHTLESAMPYICSFGSSFLLMVFLNFFLTENDGHHWILFVEDNYLINKIRQYNGGYILLATIIGLIVVMNADKSQNGTIAASFLLGIIIHECIGLATSIFAGNGNTATTIAKQGILGFIYLEIIDASFSLDGVVGAFAISTNIIIIMIGLSIGAMFVRSLTIMFVKQKTLAKYIYLEHGAHYAIGFLAIVLMLKIFIHIPEILAGGVGILILFIAFIHSLIANKRITK